MNRWIIFMLFAVGMEHMPAHSQEDFYSLNNIPEIRMTFREKNWKQLLDTLIFTGDGKGRLLGEVLIDGQLLTDVGIRYKGFSSVNPGDRKNPFSIELDYKIAGKNYQGFTSIKLSNVIEDPSFIREVLSYRIARKYMPASRANFANVYVNDTLIGLYTNVEAVDKSFIARHYPSNTNSFFKGDPLHLVYPFGQNANLGFTHGTDSTAYIPYYAIESDYGWSDLYNLINVLNNEPDSLYKVLNIDETLWMHAFNFVLLNLDSYIGYAQNYYLYEDDFGRFNPIVWDLNMSLGSFRHSDGSYHFQGITIGKMETLDPYQYLTFSVSPRPLITQLFANQTFKKMFVAHMRTIVNENFKNNDYYMQGQAIQNMIDSNVIADTNKFYTYDDFKSNLTVLVGGSGGMLEYPGIKELMEARMAYLEKLPGLLGQPVISDVVHDPAFPSRNNEVYITARINDVQQATLAYRNGSNYLFKKKSMSDDGLNHDGEAGDGIYGASIIASGNIVQYYIYAENDSAAAFSPERAEYEFHSFQTVIRHGDLVINEFKTNNQSGSAIEQGTSGWIELCNNTNENLSLAGLYLSDEQGNPLKYELPDTIIPIKKYIIVWDNDNTSSQGLHSNFSLSENGGKIYLSYPGQIVVDSVTYGVQFTGKSTGRYPNGYGDFHFLKPTIAACNRLNSQNEKELVIFPNPSNGNIWLKMKDFTGSSVVLIYDATGREMSSTVLNNQSGSSDEVLAELSVSGFVGGIYLLKIITPEKVISSTFVLY
jgi:spore coat protein CotH